jgi:NitT/TauT family transport system ATP-binding protein
VGKSGTGKTTLMRVLGGFISPTAGTLEFEGAQRRGPSRAVITVFQDYGHALLPWRTVASNVALGLENELPKAELRDRVLGSLAMVGLESRADEYPWRLSGGMQQRVQIARAIAMRPKVLLMDEPFGALDAITKASLQDQLLELQQELGTTIIFITHDIEEAIYLSDRICLVSGFPGTIELTLVTDLPRPRDQLVTRELPDYLRLRHTLGESLRGRHD